MPSTFAEEEHIMREFGAIRGFPTAIDYIGCTHIKICKCGGDAAQYYINRKGYYSLDVFFLIIILTKHYRHVVRPFF